MTTTTSSRTRAARPRATNRSDSSDVTASVDAFRRILRELRRAARKTQLATGLTAAQTFVLNAVSGAPGCSLSAIAGFTMTDRTSVAAIVDRLVAERYLTRAQADEDRRRASLRITARGQRAIRQAAPPPTKLLVDAIRMMPSPDRAALAKALRVLTEQMGIADQPASMLFEDEPRRESAKKRR